MLRFTGSSPLNEALTQLHPALEQFINEELPEAPRIRGGCWSALRHSQRENGRNIDQIGFILRIEGAGRMGTMRRASVKRETENDGIRWKSGRLEVLMPSGSSKAILKHPQLSFAYKVNS